MKESLKYSQLLMDSVEVDSSLPTFSPLRELGAYLKASVLYSGCWSGI